MASMDLEHQWLENILSFREWEDAAISKQKPNYIHNLLFEMKTDTIIL